MNKFPISLYKSKNISLTQENTEQRVKQSIMLEH